MRRIDIHIETGDWTRVESRVRSRALREELLSRLTGLDRAASLIERSAMGKPSLPAYPQLQWSSSSCAGAAGIAWCIGDPVGLDIEYRRPDFVDDQLLRSCLSPREQAEHQALPSGRDRAFYDCWTRKEAALKCLGLGLHTRPQEVEVGPARVAWQQIRLAPHGDCVLRSLAPLGPVHIAIAAGQPAEIALRVTDHSGASPASEECSSTRTRMIT